jgi:hypothetical protein
MIHQSLEMARGTLEERNALLGRSTSVELGLPDLPRGSSVRRKNLGYLLTDTEEDLVLEVGWQRIIRARTLGTANAITYANCESLLIVQVLRDTPRTSPW